MWLTLNVIPTLGYATLSKFRNLKSKKETHKNVGQSKRNLCANFD